MTLVTISVFGHFAIIWKWKDTQSLAKAIMARTGKVEGNYNIFPNEMDKNEDTWPGRKKQKDGNNHFSPVYWTVPQRLHLDN